MLIKTREMQKLEQSRLEGEPIEQVLRALYVDQNLTLAEISDRWGISISALSRWLRELGIEARPVGSRRRESPGG